MNAPKSKPQAMPEELPTPVVPDHEVIRRIGRGSGGQVWLARNALGSYRAIKVVHANAFRHRRPFEQEFEGILKFEPLSRSHDGLVDILQVGFNDAEEYFYCVMELADDVASGQQFSPENYQPRTLAHDWRRLKRLPIEECVRLGAAMASALSFLHKHGLTHRDVKPSNIIFVGGVPKLADTGLVTDVSDVNSYVGTEGFIPPEGSGSMPGDIYALGKVLYEISTGNDRHAYPELPDDLGNQVEQCDFVELNKIILKACRANPTQRYLTADAMLLALLNFQFNANALRHERRMALLTKWAAVIGAAVASGVVISIFWRIVSLTKQGP